MERLEEADLKKNLIPDGEFESGAWKPFWRKGRWGDQEAVNVSAASDFLQGRNSLKMGEPAKGKVNALVSRHMPARSNQTVVMTLWAKADTPQPLRLNLDFEQQFGKHLYQERIGTHSHVAEIHGRLSLRIQRIVIGNVAVGIGNFTDKKGFGGTLDPIDFPNFRSSHQDRVEKVRTVTVKIHGGIVIAVGTAAVFVGRPVDRKRIRDRQLSKIRSEKSVRF